jgi:hypothetical protein
MSERKNRRRIPDRKAAGHFRNRSTQKWVHHLALLVFSGLFFATIFISTDENPRLF